MTLPASNSMIHWVDKENDRCHVALVTGLDYGHGAPVSMIHIRMWDDDGEPLNMVFPNKRGSWHDRFVCPRLTVSPKRIEAMDA